MELRPLSKFTSWVDIQSQPAFPSISHFPDLPCLRVRGPQRTQTSFHSNFWSVLPHPQKIDNLSHLHACSVAKSCLTCSPPGSSIHGIFQARILEWVTISYSRNNKSSLILHPGIKPVSPASPALVGGFLTIAPPGKFLTHLVTAKTSPLVGASPFHCKKPNY